VDTVTTDELKALVKTNLKINSTEKDLIITDIIQDALNYCNLAELPVEAETYIRKKVHTVINYELENGTGSVFDVKSIKEGDTSITYNTDEVSRETVYGLSTRDKECLRRFRRLR
jgi:hypothetical protein